MSERILTMTRADADRIYAEANLPYIMRRIDLEKHRDAVLAVAREAERRMIERLRAVDVERIAHVWAPGFIPGTAAQIREALIAAVTGGEE